MLPVALDLRRMAVALIGNGARAERRLRLLEEAGADQLAVFAPAPSPVLAAAAGDRLIARLPEEGELARFALVFIADLPPAASSALAQQARDAGALVNAEDLVPLCDFHSQAVIRRGDLMLAVSTNGRSPALSRLVQRFLDRLFPAAWSARVSSAGRLRRRMRGLGAGGERIAGATARLAARQGWLPDPVVVASGDHPVGILADDAPRQCPTRRTALE